MPTWVPSHVPLAQATRLATLPLGKAGVERSKHIWEMQFWELGQVLWLKFPLPIPLYDGWKIWKDK